MRFHCIWDDHGKIIKQYPQKSVNTRDCNAVWAPLNSVIKIRNAITHNTVTISKEYQDEVTLFLKKYISRL